MYMYMFFLCDWQCMLLMSALLLFIFFQAQINDCDGVVDGPSSGSEESLLMADCLHLLLQALLTLFSW